MGRMGQPPIGAARGPAGGGAGWVQRGIWPLIPRHALRGLPVAWPGWAPWVIARPTGIACVVGAPGGSGYKSYMVSSYGRGIRAYGGGGRGERDGRGAGGEAYDLARGDGDPPPRGGRRDDWGLPLRVYQIFDFPFVLFVSFVPSGLAGRCGALGAKRRWGEDWRQVLAWFVQ